jgi:hypothetical protein
MLNDCSQSLFIRHEIRIRCRIASDEKNANEERDATSLRLERKEERSHSTTFEEKERSHSTTLEKKRESHSTTLEEERKSHSTTFEKREERSHSTTLSSSIRRRNE